MAVRWRKGSTAMVCAAESKAKKGDTYIDDRLHYKLSEELRVLVTKNSGRTWQWRRKK